MTLSMIRKNNLLKYFICWIVSFAFSSLAIAQEINMYEQPKIDAKVIGTADLTIGVIPIYSPKGSDWVKIADPRNGNVGWIKSSDLNQETQNSSNVTLTQRIINDGKGPHTYQIIEYGQPHKLTEQQVQEMVQKMQQQQQTMRQSMQKAINDMLQDMHNLYETNWNMGGFPVIMPVVILPTQPSVKTNQPPVKTKQPVQVNQSIQNQQNEPLKHLKQKNPVINNQKTGN